MERKKEDCKRGKKKSANYLNMVYFAMSLSLSSSTSDI